MAKACFDSLPDEILFQTLSDLSADDILSLSVLSRSLHNVCYDALLYRGIIEAQQAKWNAYSLNLTEIQKRAGKDAQVVARYSDDFFNLTQRAGLWEEDSFTSSVLHQRLGNDTEAWVRYATADARVFTRCHRLTAWQRAGKALQEERGHDNIPNPWSEESMNASLLYLPQLMILKHPSIHSPTLVGSLLAQVATAQAAPDIRFGFSDTKLDSRLAFSFCATLLAQDTPIFPAHLKIKDQRTALEQLFLTRLLDMQMLFKEAGVIRQSNAQMVIGLFSCLLRRAFREYKIRRMIGIKYYTFILPFALDIPIHMDASWPKLPLPFDKDEKACSASGEGKHNFESWLDDHVHALTDPSYLQDDSDWVGCYCEMVPGSIRPEFEAPMQDIHFTVTKLQESTNGETYRLQATGTDSLARFSLYGTMSRDGSIRLRKQYGNGNRLEWACVMTPFGITGLWGTENMRVIKGALWLWKKSWIER